MGWRKIRCGPEVIKYENSVKETSNEENLVLGRAAGWGRREKERNLSFPVEQSTSGKKEITNIRSIINNNNNNNDNNNDNNNPANVDCSFYRYTNQDLRNHTNHRCKHKTWTREDNLLGLGCYFWSNPTQRGYRKKMIEIWKECSSFQTVMFWPVNPAKNAIQGDAPEGSDTF